MSQLFTLLITVYVQQPQKLDAERLEKMMVFCRQKLTQGMQDYQLASGHNLAEEFDMNLIEIANIKHSELQAMSTLTP